MKFVSISVRSLTRDTLCSPGEREGLLKFVSISVRSLTRDTLCSPGEREGLLKSVFISVRSLTHHTVRPPIERGGGVLVPQVQHVMMHWKAPGPYFLSVREETD